MIFQPFYYPETGCAAYLLGCAGKGTCAVVDAHLDDVERAWNLLLCLGRDEFVGATSSGIPAKPAEMERVMLANQGRA